MLSIWLRVRSITCGLANITPCETVTSCVMGKRPPGMYSNVDQLVCLGNAIGKVKFLMPRDMWPILPGGMPYIAIKP